MKKSKDKDLVWVEDVRAKMILPKADKKLEKPIGRSVFDIHLKKHGIKPKRLAHGVTHRAYITSSEAAEIEKIFRLNHWKLFQKETGK